MVAIDTAIRKVCTIYSLYIHYRRVTANISYYNDRESYDYSRNYSTNRCSTRAKSIRSLSKQRHRVTSISQIFSEGATLWRRLVTPNYMHACLNVFLDGLMEGNYSRQTEVALVFCYETLQWVICKPDSRVGRFVVHKKKERRISLRLLGILYLSGLREAKMLSLLGRGLLSTRDNPVAAIFVGRNTFHVRYHQI